MRQLAGSGWPLNDVLEELQKRPGGATEPGPRLDAWALKRLNLIGKSGVDVGLIRRAGESWPATLRDYAYDRERRQVDTLLAKAVGQVREGKEPEAAVLEGLEESARALGTKLYWRGESTEPQNSEARFFLKSLEGAIQGLRDPEARRSLACAEELPAKVKTADALVRYLTEKKLRFGRAVGDDWRAYFVVYVHLEHYAAQLKARPKRK